MMDARRAISRLNNYVILGNKLSEFGRIEVGESSLRSNYDPNKKDEEVVKEKNTNIVVQGHVEEEQLWNLQRCLVDEELFEVLKQNDWVYLREFFIKIELWSETTMVEEREESWREGRRIAGFSTGLGRHCCFRIEITDESRNSSQNIYRLDEEMISGIRIETRVGERAKNGYNNRARKEVSNMGFTIDELGLKNEEGAQEEQQISEEGMGLAKNKNNNGRKIRSMYEIQNRLLTVTEKKKRDWALRKQKGKGIAGRDEVVVNASLSDSDISNRKKVILMEARNMWEVGKKLGFSVWVTNEMLLKRL
ncbi:hypothetical protein Gorai_006046 [Gossypium raimondii]|uniref:DUF4283 domain-containing protein n=1 Tax=Gossypium raimondii TaxID=29730 RepID=A0A7J8QEX4_GOSRA|nr:hypothetical protein [Gossypium raimondii]